MSQKYVLPHTITLRDPILSKSGEMTSTITFTRKLRVSDIEGIPDTLSAVDRQTRILSRLLDIPSAGVRQMDLNDFVDAGRVLDSFLESSPLTGVV